MSTQTTPFLDMVTILLFENYQAENRQRRKSRPPSGRQSNVFTVHSQCHFNQIELDYRLIYLE